MKTPSLEILAFEETPLGPLCLRRRTTLAEPVESVTEVTLDHAFLMSSLNTDSERALAEIPISKNPGEALSVLIGGLGLGYTAAAALASNRVTRVEVVEYLPQVIGWLHRGLIPLADALNADPRLSIVEGDIYARLASRNVTQGFDLILIDVDHSPQERLGDSSDSFYAPDTMACAATHLRTGGILALWSVADDHATFESMKSVFDEVSVHPITYFNRHVNEPFTDYILLGRMRLDEPTVPSRPSDRPKPES